MLSNHADELDLLVDHHHRAAEVPLLVLESLLLKKACDFFISTVEMLPGVTSGDGFNQQGDVSHLPVGLLGSERQQRETTSTACCYGRAI
ncbi:MAG: hypothetical protein ABR555_07420 [Pyrinomonadaceae bacterium]